MVRSMEARMKRLVVVALVLALGATGAWADPYGDCGQSVDLDRTIQGCTQIIDGGDKENANNRSLAYFERGNAYAKTRAYDRAIADYTKAIEIDPKFVEAYYKRGFAYGKVGDREKNEADFGKALAIQEEQSINAPTEGEKTEREALEELEDLFKK
jgi:tetratricopeptide (TPR) repeat protein